jgi:predicted MFS family arabinose efflux permease
VVLTVPVIGVGVTLAPAVGGMLTAAGGHTALLIAGAVSVLAALSLDLMALRLGLPHVDPKAAMPVD